MDKQNENFNAVLLTEQTLNLNTQVWSVCRDMILQSTVNQVKRTKDQEQCPDVVCKTKVSFSDEKGGFICSEGSSVWRFGVVNLVLSIAKKKQQPKNTVCKNRAEMQFCSSHFTWKLLYWHDHIRIQSSSNTIYNINQSIIVIIDVVINSSPEIQNILIRYYIFLPEKKEKVSVTLTLNSNRDPTFVHSNLL